MRRQPLNEQIIAREKKGKRKKRGFFSIGYVTPENHGYIMPPIKYCKYNFGKKIKIIIIIIKTKTNNPIFHTFVVVLPDKQIYHMSFPSCSQNSSFLVDLKICCKKAQETL